MDIYNNYTFEIIINIINIYNLWQKILSYINIFVFLVKKSNFTKHNELINNSEYLLVDKFCIYFRNPWIFIIKNRFITNV